jgi:hypothetical protein
VDSRKAGEAASTNTYRSSDKRLLGGTYTISAAVLVLNLPTTIPRLGADIGGVGLGDAYIERRSLGWNLSKG